MQDLTSNIVELIRLASTSLPADVESALASSLEMKEDGTPAQYVLQAILKNIEIARAESIPLCQDTGTPIFYVRYPTGYSSIQLKKLIRSAVSEATAKSFLRPNAVDGITGKNSGNNLGDSYFPTIHFEEIEGEIFNN